MNMNVCMYIVSVFVSEYVFANQERTSFFDGDYVWANLYVCKIASVIVGVTARICALGNVDIFALVHVFVIACKHEYDLMNFTLFL